MYILTYLLLLLGLAVGLCLSLFGIIAVSPWFWVLIIPAACAFSLFAVLLHTIVAGLFWVVKLPLKILAPDSDNKNKGSS